MQMSIIAKYQMQPSSANDLKFTERLLNAHEGQDERLEEGNRKA